ncbi:unnamed protein product [Rotaria sp. Silwood2]|nr:unnamed protein product [Rotaria sp. Silwood2]
MVIGVGTEVIQGESLILTAGAIDACAYFTSPDVVTEAVMSGVTTMFGGGTGMNGSVTMSTPGPNHIKYMIQSTDDYPMNFGFYGKGNTSKAEGLSKELEDQIVAGAIGTTYTMDQKKTSATTPVAAADTGSEHTNMSLRRPPYARMV